MQSLLQGVVLRGTGEAARVLGRTGVGGKTGTTNDSRDTWFMGITPDIVVATYVGFDTPKSLGAKETGGRVAIQGFIKFMQQAGQSIPDRDFPVPRASTSCRSTAIPASRLARASPSTARRT